jgi:hypothetical protein
MWHNVSNFVVEFLTKRGISPLLLIIPLYLIGIYQAVKIIRNWSLSRPQDKFRAVAFLIAAFLSLCSFTIYFLQK